MAIRHVTLSVQDDEGRSIVAVGVKLEVFNDGSTRDPWVARAKNDPGVRPRYKVARGVSDTHAIGIWLSKFVVP